LIPESAIIPVRQAGAKNKLQTLRLMRLDCTYGSESAGGKVSEQKREDKRNHLGKSVWTGMKKTGRWGDTAGRKTKRKTFIRRSGRGVLRPSISSYNGKDGELSEML
jgi:hypothetical protein